MSTRLRTDFRASPSAERFRGVTKGKRLFTWMERMAEDEKIGWFLLVVPILLLRVKKIFV